MIIHVLAEYGIQGERDPEYTGVWVGGWKVAAIGKPVFWRSFCSLARKKFVISYLERVWILSGRRILRELPLTSVRADLSMCVSAIRFSLSPAAFSK